MGTRINQLLASDHAELDELLARLLSGFEAADAQQIYQRLDIFWARLAMHIRAEHLHLFPAILDAVRSQRHKEDVPSLEIVKHKIAKLQEDHNFFMRELLSGIKQLRGLQDSNPISELPCLSKVREVIVEVSRRLEKHNEMEESEAYVWADMLLNTVARADLSEKVQKELVNLPQRFKPGTPTTNFD